VAASLQVFQPQGLIFFIPLIPAICPAHFIILCLILLTIFTSVAEYNYEAHHKKFSIYKWICLCTSAERTVASKATIFRVGILFRIAYVSGSEGSTAMVATGLYTPNSTKFSAVAEQRLEQQRCFHISVCVFANFDVTRIFPLTELRFRIHTWVSPCILFTWT
jgi:hypothetical protein